MAFKIAITNFENGNEKTEYMTLPAEGKTITDTIEKAGICGETILRICSCEKFPELVGADFDGKPTLDELNILAEKLEKVAESDLDIAAYRGLLRDGIYTVRDAICCALNTNTVVVYRCKDFEEYGKFAMSDLLFGEFSDIPYKTNGDVDYEKIGQIEHEKNGGYFIGDYYVITETYFDEVGFGEKAAQSESGIAEEKNNIAMGGIS